mgnify:CR=1 FL=1
MEHKYISGGGRGLCSKGWHTNHYTQLNVCDYMADIPNNTEVTDLVEVQFKNTRKGYYHNSNGLELKKGDIVAVEGNPGHVFPPQAWARLLPYPRGCSAGRYRPR